MGNVVQRDDALYARMKQRDIDAHDSMWEPIFVDDAALGLGDSKNKVLKTFIKTVMAYSAANLFETPSIFTTCSHFQLVTYGRLVRNPF